MNLHVRKEGTAATSRPLINKCTHALPRARLLSRCPCVLPRAVLRHRTHQMLVAFAQHPAHPSAKTWHMPRLQQFLCSRGQQPCALRVALRPGVARVRCGARRVARASHPTRVASPWLPPAAVLFCKIVVLHPAGHLLHLHTRAHEWASSPHARSHACIRLLEMPPPLSCSSCKTILAFRGTADLLVCSAPRRWPSCFSESSRGLPF